MEISKERLIKIQYDKEKSTPGLAWLNLFGLSFLGGLGYYCTAKGDSDQVMKGVAWSATSLILFIMGRSYLINYTGLVVSALCIYLFLIADTVRLYFERKKHNAGILQKITEEVNSSAKNDIDSYKEESYGVNKVVAEEVDPYHHHYETLKTAETKSRQMSDTEFNELVIKLSEQRIKDGYDPLSKEQVNRMREIYQQGDKD